jgi:hypothetical protein
MNGRSEHEHDFQEAYCFILEVNVPSNIMPDWRFVHSAVEPLDDLLSND